MNWKLLAGIAVAGVTLLIANAAAKKSHDATPEVARGKYLVDAIGCIDCHTPLVMGPKGPERDMTHHLAGHPQGMSLATAPELPAGPWGFVGSGSMTAWSGPWGTSFTANLTPDRETGLGNWTADQFVQAIRSQRHLGRGRPILPPMPSANYANLSDEDLRAIFAYLQTLPPVSNRVPEPLPPAEAH